jgi:cell division protein ZapA (FtsZ GTPase activity inhibitor)
MQNNAKKLIELATIDLLYAQLELRCANQQSDAMKRIALHLDEMASHLSGLTRVLQIADAASGEMDRKKRHSA